MIEFQLEITNSIGTPYGSGPLTSVTSFSHTARLSRGGTIAFDFAASDEQAEHVLSKRLVIARALLGDSWQQVGRGVIDKIDTVPGQDGNVAIRVSGPDFLGRLITRNIRELEIGAETGATLDEALEIIHDFVDDLALWESYDVTGSVPNDYFYAKFAGESVLGALIYLADKTQTFFRLDDSELINIIFSASFTDSGVRAIQAQGDLSDNTCAITSLTRTVDTQDLLTRMYVAGAGEDWDSSLKLDACSPGTVAPVGFTLNRDESYIEDDTATAAYGLVDFPVFQFKEIDTISNTDADYQAAADFLFQCAFLELVKRSTLATQYSYSLTVAGCNRRLLPGQTIRLVYYDPTQGIDINDDLFILESTTQWDATGVRTTSLQVSTDPIWPKSSGENAASRVAQQRIFQAHPQISLNEWWENATLILGFDQADHIAEFPFVLGRSVIMVKQVVFRFKIERVLTAGYVYRLSDDETELNDADDTGDTAVTIDDTAVIVDDATVAITPTNVTVNNETVTINTNAAGISADSITIDGTVATVNITTGTATDLSSETPDTGLPAGSSEFTDLNYLGIDSATQAALGPGSHHHDMSTHIHEHQHWHTVATHTHTIDTEHGHESPSHTHTNTAHTHTSPAHGHTAAAHNHTTVTHTHVLSDHDHTSPDHSHTSPDHHHPVPQHVHVVPQLLETFEVTRALASQTFAMDELEYAVNGGGWVDLDTATGTGDGYFQIDITADLIGSIPFRPAQTSGNNLVEVRRKGGSSFTITDFVLVAPLTEVVTSVAHGLSIGDQVRITGTSYHNGIYVVQATPSSTVFSIVHNSPLGEFSGTVTVDKSCMLLCKLGVRTVIGAIPFVA